eukprot:CAMPEP_0118957320 /NCGR_PEP_ID=MMETSP1169-20130426/62034_1 /TAXON_ID=36882 /ORGANISM="Pyramimonas obovata, Strain CCMP722" /LENGTH=98 /DNA_ID=CAMNT_0006905385 /DNA_START=595 /DNA_END=891 /DNA_ORIENTATION=+
MAAPGGDGGGEGGGEARGAKGGDSWLSGGGGDDDGGEELLSEEPPVSTRASTTAPTTRSMHTQMHEHNTQFLPLHLVPCASGMSIEPNPAKPSKLRFG